MEVGVFEEQKFDEVRKPCGYKENSDIYPVGRCAERAVEGVKEDGDKRYADSNTDKFDLPKIRVGF